MTIMTSTESNRPPFHQCYHLSDEELGSGNYSTVYKGTSVHLQKHATCSIDKQDEMIPTKPIKGYNNIRPTYAIKQIPKEKLGKEDVKSIFDEVAILQHLNHPHIIQLHDFFDEDKFYYLVMERVTGGELFDRITAKEYYNENEARNVLKILLDALEYMHNQGIVHRDLKPENLLLVEKGNDSLIKIADFGFSKHCDDSSNKGMGNLKTQCGTPFFVSPEILRRLPYGTKSDMWSVGIILYILLGGYPPFIEDDNRVLFRKICNCDYEFRKEYFDKVSDDAKYLISSLLEVNPKKRLSAREALDNLWICSDDETLSNKDLTGVNFDKLKKYNAKRKVRAAVYSLNAVNRLTSVLCSDLRVKVGTK